MKITTILYLVKDAFGNKASAVCEDPSDTIYLGGLMDKDGYNCPYESEAYHLKQHCEDENYELKEIKTERDFDAVWEDNISGPIKIILTKMESGNIKLTANTSTDELLKFGMKLQLSLINMETKFELIHIFNPFELSFEIMESSFEEITDLLTYQFTPSELHITID